MDLSIELLLMAVVAILALRFENRFCHRQKVVVYVSPGNRWFRYLAFVLFLRHFPVNTWHKGFFRSLFDSDHHALRETSPLRRRRRIESAFSCDDPKRSIVCDDI